MKRGVFPGVLMGCLILSTSLFSAFDENILYDNSIRKELEPSTLSLACESYLIRIDLVRASDTSKSSTPNPNGPGSSTTTISTPRPYGEFCVYFGNGIMIDNNQNIFLDLVSFFGLAQGGDFKVTDVIGNGKKPVKSYERRSNIYTMSKPNAKKPSRKVVFGTNQTIFKQSSKPEKTIAVSPERLELLSGRSPMIVTLESNKATFPKMEVELLPAQSIQIRRNTLGLAKKEGILGELLGFATYAKVNNSGTFITISFPSTEFTTGSSYTFFKTENGCYFFKNYASFKDRKIIQIERAGNEIIIHDYLLFGDQKTVKIIE